MTKQQEPELNIQYITAGIDVGNGYTKSCMNNQLHIVQSHAVKQYNITNDEKLRDDQYANFITNIENEMDASFISPLVTDTTRRLFGKRAIQSYQPIEQFDVRATKSEADLYGCLLLSTLATHALKQDYAVTKAMPTEINVVVRLATSLPINEYKTKNKEIREKLLNKGQAHIVTIHNFERTITIKIQIAKVHIASEGEAAQYGLAAAEEPLLTYIKEEMLRHYGDKYKEYDGIDYVTAENTLGIDIGEGTMDFAIFTDRKFDRTLSYTVNKGYRTVLEDTLDTLSTQGNTYKSTKELAEALANQPSKFKRAQWEHAQEINKRSIVAMCDLIRDEVSRSIERVGSYVEVVFVYGGGATALKDELYKQLDRISQRQSNGNEIPIVYLSNEYSQYLNTHGLFLLASSLN